MIKFIANHTPKYFLPPAQKQVCNVQTHETKIIELMTQEKRERLANAIDYKINQALDRYSPLRKYRLRKKNAYSL